MELKERIYMSMNGLLMPDYAVADVTDEFVPGKKSYELYSQMLDAYISACERLGCDAGDEDLEIIINSLLALGEEQAYLMYDYGARFGQGARCEVDDTAAEID